MTEKVRSAVGMGRFRGWSTPFFLLLITALVGCGIAAKVRARDDMEVSKAAYKECLKQEGDNLAACDRFKKAYEADLQAYQATSAALHSDKVVAIERE